MIRPIFIILFGFLLRAGYGLYISIIGVDAGLEPDALKFYSDIVASHRTGTFMEFTLGPNIYINFTLIFAQFFGTSPFVICLFSALLWLIGAVFFLKACEDLKVPAAMTVLAASLYAFWPSAILYTAEPLRESMQLMFTTLLMFACIRSLTRGSIGYGVWAFFFAIGAGSTHGAVAASSAAIFGIYIILFTVYRKESISFGVVALNIVLALGFMGLFFSLFSLISYDLSIGALEAMTRYQEGSLASVNRADYRNDISGTTIAQAIVGIPIGFFQYLFEPLPGRSFAALDLALMAENGLRFLLILAAIRNIFSAGEMHKRLLVLFVFVAYLGAELIWSVGTINWGQASRHHVPAMALLILPFAMRDYQWVPKIRQEESRLISA